MVQNGVCGENDMWSKFFKDEFESFDIRSIALNFGRMQIVMKIDVL